MDSFEEFCMRYKLDEGDTQSEDFYRVYKSDYSDIYRSYEERKEKRKMLETIEDGNMRDELMILRVEGRKRWKKG